MICKQCGKQLNRKKKFCNSKCRYAWWKEHPERRKTYKKQCKHCLMCYETNRFRQKHCTAYCRDLAMSANSDNPRVLKERKCALSICGKTFKTKDQWRLCCCPEHGKLQAGKTYAMVMYSVKLDYPDNYLEMSEIERSNWRQNIK